MLRYARQRPAVQGALLDPKTASLAAPDASADRPRRVIKRYSNRKLYDTRDSRYVTLPQVAEMIRGGEEVQIVDNKSKEDLTEVTLAQILFEEQKSHTRGVPLQTLKDLLHQRTENVLSQLREGPIGRLIPGSRPEERIEEPPKQEPKPGLVDQAKVAIEDWQHRIDERVRAVLTSLRPWQQLEDEVQSLKKRVEELEAKLAEAKREP